MAIPNVWQAKREMSQLPSTLEGPPTMLIQSYVWSPKSIADVKGVSLHIVCDLDGRPRIYMEGENLFPKVHCATLCMLSEGATRLDWIDPLPVSGSGYSNRIHFDLDDQGVNNFLLSLQRVDEVEVWLDVHGDGRENDYFLFTTSGVHSALAFAEIWT